MTAVHRYPPGITNVGGLCWCQSMFLAAHILSSEVDGTVHARGWCDRLRPVPLIPPAAEAGGAVTAPLSP